jgi:hypothetical protein
MTCQRRIKTGECNHHQCTNSSSGFQCVLISSVYCDAGNVCKATACKFKWTESSRETAETALYGAPLRSKYLDIEDPPPEISIQEASETE